MRKVCRKKGVICSQIGMKYATDVFFYIVADLKVLVEIAFVIWHKTDDAREE
jgi:hypothetical protein